jgi:hypothetical protein
MRDAAHQDKRPAGTAGLQGTRWRQPSTPFVPADVGDMATGGDRRLQGCRMETAVSAVLDRDIGTDGDRRHGPAEDRRLQGCRMETAVPRRCEENWRPLEER